MGRLYDAYVEVGPRFSGFNDIKRQGDQAGKQYGKALADAAAKAAAANVRNLGQALAKARDAEADAAGKVRVAEAKLQDVRKNSKSSAAAVAAAEEQLAAAQRKSATASTAAKDAAEALGKAQKTAAEAADKAGKYSGGRFSTAFRTAAGKMGGEKEGRAFATRFGVGMNGAIGGIVSRSAGLFVAGFAAVKSVQVFGGFIKDAAYSAQVARVSAQAIKSTGGAAKITADQVGNLATAISNNTGADDEAIQSGENLLLTFTNIRNGVGKGNDIFNQAAAAITDMTAAMNDGQVTQEGLKTSAIQVGKALNDPLKGITALQKVGVTFTADQKKQIKTLVDSGKTMQAQKIILGELGKEFGGAAKAASDPFTRFKTIAGNLSEQIGGYLLPYANKFTDWVTGKAIPGISGLADLLLKGDFTGAFGKAFNVEEDSGVVTFLLKVHDVGAKVFTELSGGIKAFGAAWKANNGDVTSSGFPGFMERLANAARTAFGFFKTEVLPRLREFATFVISNVIPSIKNLVAAFTPIAKEIAGTVVGAFQKLGPAILSVGQFVGGILPAFKNFTGFLRDNTTLVGAVAVGVLAMVGAYKAYQGALLVASIAGKAYAAVQAAINFVMSANPIGIVVLAVVGLAAGLIYAYKHSEKFRDIVNGAFNAVKGVVLTVYGALKTAVGAVVTAFIATKNAIGTAFSAVGSAVGTVVTTVKSAFSAAVGFVKAVWTGIINAVSGPVNAVIGFLGAVWSRISPILQLPFYIALRTIQSVWKAITIAFTAAKNWVAGAFAKAWSVVGPIISLPIQGAKLLLDRIWTGIRVAFSATKNWVTGAFSKTWSAVKAVISVPISGAKILLDGIWTGIRIAFNATKNYVTGAFARAWAGLKAIITTPINLAKSAISTALSAGKGGLRWVFSQAVSSIGSIWSGLQSLAKKPIKFIVNTVLNSGLIDGFNWIAKKFNAPTIDHIPLPKGFAAGGYFSGRLPGPPSAVDNLLGYAKGGQMFGLAGGEFVVNAKQTKKHLPTLMAMNAGMDGYADGGLIGTLKKAITTGINAVNPLGGALNAIDAATTKFLGNPVDWLKNRFTAPLKALDQLGNSAVAQVVKAVPRKIATTIEDAAKSLVGLGGPAAGGYTDIGPQVGTGANRWRSVALAALAAAGAPAAWINSLLRRMNQESGGNPRAINLWDSNAMRGTPSIGLMQTIGPTFNAYAGPYRSRGIYDPFANIYAAIKYTIARYGSGPAGWDRKGGYFGGGLIPGYATGSWEIPRDQLAMIHRGEMVIPAKPAKALRSFTSPAQRVRSKLHQLHLQHEAHQDHVSHLDHLTAVGRSGYLGPVGRGAIGADTNGGLQLHPASVQAIVRALENRPMQLFIDGRQIDTALSSSAIDRGYR